MNENIENRTKTKRIPFEEKLKIVGISDSEFRFFFKLFVQDPQYYLKKKEGEGWQVATTKAGRHLRLDKNVVASHLMQKYCIATFPHEPPSIFVLSLAMLKSCHGLTMQ